MFLLLIIIAFLIIDILGTCYVKKIADISAAIVYFIYGLLIILAFTLCYLTIQ